jgi:tyrosine-protein phosphatase YwqE
MNFLKNIFSSRNKIPAIDFSILKTDMHSHLIPGIDDGSKSTAESIDLIKQLYEMGFRKIITTPHIMHDYYKNTPSVINAGLDNLRKNIAEEKINIKLEAAAEYMVDDGFKERIAKNELLTFGDKYLLIELSSFSPHPELSEILFDLQVAGYKVILAHPERYSYWFNEFNKYEELKDRQIFFQLNSVSLSGYYGQPVKKMAEKLVDEKMIDFVGSDMHNQTYMDALELSRREKYMHQLVDSGQLKNREL